MARPREYDDDLRLRLIETAAHLLAHDGPASVTTRRVATAAGTSTSAIYALIGSKDDLMRAIRQEGFARLAAHLRAVPATGEPLEDLRRLGHAYFDMALESPDLYRVMFGDAPAALATVGPHRAPGDGDDQGTLAVLVDAVRRCTEARLVTGDPFAAALQLWAVAHGVVSLAIAGALGPPEAARQLFDAAGGSLRRGLAPDEDQVASAPLPAATVEETGPTAVRARA